MEGFFTKKETAVSNRINGKLVTCTSCGLRVPDSGFHSFGGFSKKILIITDGLISQKKLKERLIKADTSITIEDIEVITVLKCPTDKIEYHQVDCCRNHVLNYIRNTKPAIIIPMGIFSIYCLIGNRWQKDFGDIGKWRGWQIPDLDIGAWVCPTYCFNEINQIGTPEMDTIWANDVKKVEALLFKDIPEKRRENIQIISDLTVLNSIKNGVISIDYETTGLKPYGQGHRIICASVAVDSENCFVFLMPETRKERVPFINLLTNPDIKKIAHNLKFEDVWTKVRLKTQIDGWHWCSMLTAHQLDNRPGITSLKFQTYVNLGVVDYDSAIAPYLSGDKKDSNSINNIQNLLETPGGVKDLLEYCGRDTLYQYALYLIQKNKISL